MSGIDNPSQPGEGESPLCWGCGTEADSGQYCARCETDRELSALWDRYSGRRAEVLEELLDAAVKCCDAAQKRVLMLTLNRCSERDIARQLGVAQRQVREIFTAAVAAIKEELGDERLTTLFKRLQSWAEDWGEPGAL